jgi:hypothetical protein
MTKLINWLKALFGTKGKVSRQTLQNVSAEDIRREKIKVEQTENRVTREIEELEQQKEALFSKGVSAGSDRQKLQYARKIKELDAQVQARDQQLALISRNLRVLNGIAQLKENERVLRDLGMEGLVNKMDLTELQTYVEKATVEGQFHMEKFNEILGALQSAEGVYKFESDDADTLAILDQMNRAADLRVRDGVRLAEMAIQKEAAVSNEAVAG